MTEMTIPTSCPTTSGAHPWPTAGPGVRRSRCGTTRPCRHWLLEYLGDDITTSLIRGRQYSSMALEFIQRVRSVIWNRILFATADVKGRTLFGLGPAGARRGNKPIFGPGPPSEAESN